MTSPRGGVGLAPLSGNLVAVGGHNGKEYLDSVEIYLVHEKRWIQVRLIFENFAKIYIRDLRQNAPVRVVALPGSSLMQINSRRNPTSRPCYQFKKTLRSWKSLSSNCAFSQSSTECYLLIVTSHLLTHKIITQQWNSIFRIRHKSCDSLSV